MDEDPIFEARTLRDEAAPWYVARRENLPYWLLPLLLGLVLLLITYRRRRSRLHEEQEAQQEWCTVHERARAAGLAQNEEAALIDVLSETDLVSNEDPVLADEYFDAFVAKPLETRTDRETVDRIRRKLFGADRNAPPASSAGSGSASDPSPERTGS
ncbi:MAG: hypothetical protein ACOCX4_00060 [Planctomycetota bacterium]